MKKEFEEAMVAELVATEAKFVEDHPELARSQRACLAGARRLVAANDCTDADRIIHKKGTRANATRTRTNKRERLPDNHPLVLKWKRESANKKGQQGKNAK